MALRGRRPIVLHDSAARAELKLLIAQAAGKPCPTSHDLADAMRVGERPVYVLLIALERAGELQTRYSAHRRNRRMRVWIDGAWSEWTEWTARNRYLVRKPRKLGHVAAVLARGGYR